MQGGNSKNQKGGFTIVELLIVVIVIAILAAITLVAFNNVTNRAKASAAASAAQQAAKKVMVYMTTNADQVPPDLATAGVTDQNGTTYQYRTYNNGQSFCITATSNGVSAFTNNVDQTSPAAGACPGHGVNGGGVITNLAINPSLKVDGTGWGVHFAAGATFTTSRVSTGGPTGGPYYSTQFTSTPSANNSISIGYGGLGSGPFISVTPGKTYALSIESRTSRGFSSCGIRYLYFTGGTQGLNGAGPSVATVANGWTRYSATSTAPSGVDGLRLMLICNTNGGPVANDIVDVTRVFAAEASTVPNYADGDSPGWTWNGNAGNSTSTGPAL